jgi:homocysteine S-methyltransferase
MVSAAGGTDVYRNALPQLGDTVFLSDSGIETDLIFNHGFELPELAAFVLLDDVAGAVALDAYFRRHIDIAVEHGCGVILESPTWRASYDWGARLGYAPEDLRRLNVAAVDLLANLRRSYQGVSGSPVVISGCIGPRADAYRPADRMAEAEAEAYHWEQIQTFASTDVDMVHAMTLTYAAEAIGIVRAAGRAGLPVAISFTTETDGRLPDRTSLAEAIAVVDVSTGHAPAYFGINCAHPSHFDSVLPDGATGARLRCIRANASKKSHAEIDASPTLDDGNPTELAADYVRLRAGRPTLSILGGCCGTDVRHIQAIADACLGASGTD